MSINNFYPTTPYQYLINQKLAADNPIADGKIIKDLINKDLQSAKKKRMQEGVNYYNIKHDILNRTMTYFVDGVEKEDRTKSNYKTMYPYHSVIVDQTVGYLVGKPIKFSTDDKNYSNEIKQYLNDNFNDMVCELVKHVQNKGKEWLYVYINPEGKLDYIIVDARQVIPIYDTRTQTLLVSLIRYYTIDVVGTDGREKQRYKVEWYDPEKVTYYIQDENDNYILDDTEPINPQYHWYSFNTNDPEKVESNSWGKVPFIKFQNNDEESTSLEKYKTIIDAIDILVADGVNNLVDIQDIIWKLVNYEGENLSEFLINLKAKKSIVVGDNGDAEPIKADIPYEARMAQLKEMKEAVWIFGRAVDPSTDKFGNSPSGVSLKFLYSLLDGKADILERKMKKSLREFLWFVTEYINRTKGTKYNHNSVKITFNRSMIANTSEMITDCQNSKGIVSDKTILENHPLVDNVDEELKRLEEQQTNINLDNSDIE